MREDIRLITKTIELNDLIRFKTQSLFEEGLIKVDDFIEGVPTYFTSRIKEVYLGTIESYFQIPKELNEELLYLSLPINNMLIELPRTISKDVVLINWFKGITEDIIAGDFGTLRFLPDQIDSINIIEGIRKPNQKDLTNIIRLHLDNQHLWSQQEVDEEKYLEGYALCGIQRHLELAAYFMGGYFDPYLNGNKKEFSLAHIDMAKSHIDYAPLSLNNKLELSKNLSEFRRIISQ